jgi:hypothetical protein
MNGTILRIADLEDQEVENVRSWWGPSIRDGFLPHCGQSEMKSRFRAIFIAATSYDHERSEDALRVFNLRAHKSLDVNDSASDVDVAVMSRERLTLNRLSGGRLRDSLIQLRDANGAS